MDYNLAVEGDDSQILIDWGNEKDWITRYRQQLDSAHRISLIPKKYSPLPVITVDVRDRNWIIFSKVFGKLSAAGHKHEIRLYAIGWQANLGGQSVKSLLWVYPNGAIESALWPGYVDQFFAAAIPPDAVSTPELTATATL